MASETTRNRFKGDLTIANVTEEEPVGRAGADLTPFLALIDQSWDAKTGEGDKAKGATLGITVPLGAKTLTETRLRDAAKERGLGCSVAVVVPGEARAAKYNLSADQCRVIFNARTKKAPVTKPASVGAPPAANGAAKAPAAKKGGMPTPTGAR